VRTTVWQIIQLAWAIYRNPARKHLRIGQIIYNCGPPDAFHIENQALINCVKRHGKNQK